MATTNAAPDPIAATAAAGEADVAMSEAKDTQPARREKKEDVNEEVADDDDRWMDVA